MYEETIRKRGIIYVTKYGQLKASKLSMNMGGGDMYEHGGGEM